MQDFIDKLDSDSRSLLALLIVFITITMLAVIFLFAMWRYYKSMRRRQEELFKASLIAQEEERGRIAEDLHDDIGPRLSALKLSVDLLRNDFTPAERTQIIDDTTDILDYVIRDIRVIVRNLAAKYIGEKGIYQQLYEFRRQIESSGVVKINMQIECFKQNLENNFAVNMYRIIQELINNSVKHAACTHIDVICGNSGGTLSIIYKDNGKGFNENEVNKGLGLNNIYTRVKLYKGRCQLNSGPGQGTTYSILFDMKNNVPHPVS